MAGEGLKIAFGWEPSLADIKAPPRLIITSAKRGDTRFQVEGGTMDASVHPLCDDGYRLGVSLPGPNSVVACWR